MCGFKSSLLIVVVCECDLHMRRLARAPFDGGTWILVCQLNCKHQNHSRTPKSCDKQKIPPNVICIYVIQTDLSTISIEFSACPLCVCSTMLGVRIARGFAYIAAMHRVRGIRKYESFSLFWHCNERAWITNGVQCELAASSLTRSSKCQMVNIINITKIKWQNPVRRQWIRIHK